jgi:predicted amidophosphoribosyltransferase
MTSCLACDAPGPGVLCAFCRTGLRPGTRRRLAGGLWAAPGLAHTGAARRLVHHLKYAGLAGTAGVLALPMATCLPSTAAALIPVPRVWVRRLRYGVDPAGELATALGRLTGLTVVHALTPPLWHPRHAARPQEHRSAPVFSRRREVPEGAVLIDDVVTTGATLLAAARALPGVVEAVTATGAA